MDSARGSHGPFLPAGEAISGESRKSVLVVEDDPGLRRLIALTLSEAGFDCVVAHDAEEGLRRASGTDVGAAVLDLNLPGMSGAELAWRLTQLVPDAHLIAVSGYLENWDAGDLSDLGISKLIPKPCDMDELVSVLEEVLPASGDVGLGRHDGPATGSPDCAQQ
jgi:DNA-binding response OmpR family regulator